MPKKLTTNMFKREDMNVLSNALKNAAHEHNLSIYDFMEGTPKTSFTVELMDEITALGYSIVKTV